MDGWLLDTGHYGPWYSFDGQLDATLQGRTLDYVFLSHQEIPHTGNLGRLFAKCPRCKAIGSISATVRSCSSDAIWKDLSSTRLHEMTPETALAVTNRPALEPNIGKLMHSMETSPPQMLQSGAKT